MDQMVMTVLRKMLLVLTSKASAPASCLPPSDLPCASQFHVPCPDCSFSFWRCVVYRTLIFTTEMPWMHDL